MAPVPGDSSKHQFGTSMPQGGHPPHHSITWLAQAGPRHVAGDRQLPDCLVCKCRLIHTCAGTYSFVAESGRRFAMTDLEGSLVTNIDSLAAHYAKPTE